MKKLILTIALTALLLIVGQAAQAEPYQLPVRVHTLVACNQGALALTYTGEVFYIAGDNAAVVQITPRFFEGGTGISGRNLQRCKWHVLHDCLWR